MDVFQHDICVKNTTVDRLKNSQKHHVYQNKSDARRKVQIVKGKLMKHYDVKGTIVKKIGLSMAYDHHKVR